MRPGPGTRHETQRPPAWPGPLRLGGAPLHPLAVHVPVTLLALVPVLDLLRITDAWGRSDFWGEAVWWVLVTGLLTGMAALGTGLMDYLALPEDPEVTRTANSHMVGMIAAVALYGLSLLLRATALPLEDGARLWLAVGAGTGGLACLAWGGHQGARLVYRHGAGRHGH